MDLLDGVLTLLRQQVEEANRKPTVVDQCESCPFHRINGSGYSNASLRVGRHLCLKSLDEDGDPRLFWGGNDVPIPKKKDIERFCELLKAR